MLLHRMLFTNIQLDNFSSTLVHLLECLRIEEPEEQEWVMMAAVNIGVLLEYGCPQGFLLHFSRLSQGGNPAVIVATTNVKLVRKAQADNHMEVNGDAL